LIDFLVYGNILLGEISMNLKIFIGVMNSLSGEKKTKALTTMLPMFLFVIAEFLLLKTRIFENHTVEVIFIAAMIYGYYTSKLIISTMTKREMPLFDTDITLYLALQVVNFFLLSEFYYLTLVLHGLFGIYIIFTYYRYMVSIAIQLLVYLKIDF